MPRLRELALEVGQGGERVGVGRLLPGGAAEPAAFEDAALQEGGAGHVLDVGRVVEPAVAPEINLFIPHAERGQHPLRPRQQGGAEPGLPLQAVLQLVHLAQQGLAAGDPPLLGDHRPHRGQRAAGDAGLGALFR